MGRVKAYFTRWRRGYLLLPLAFLLLIYLSSGEAELPEVEISLPQVRTLVERIPASGKIKPVKEVRISPDVSGEVVEIGCREGEWVERGTLLIKIKQDIYLSAVERAEALLQAAEAERREQEANVERMEGRLRRDSLLFCNQALSQREYEESQWDYKIALEQLRGALYNIETCRAELKESRENLFKSTIYAPISGYVTKIYVELGERVVGTSQMAGTIMLCIADMG
ncbi:MAG: biotin/lipoyl-binding protein, partial [Bacteroidales bacterium]|nr:biotin/lipoyl-binding protein [Bacteroidales bacterium]